MRKCYISCKTNDGTWLIKEAYHVSACWSIWKDGRFWNITHVPTGSRLTYAYLLKNAAALCKDLDAAVDWNVDINTIREYRRENEIVRSIIDRYYTRGLITSSM